MFVKDDIIRIDEGEIVYINLYPYMSVNMRVVKLDKDMFDAVKDVPQEDRIVLYNILSRWR